MKRFGLLMGLVMLASCSEDVPIRLAPWDLESGTLDEDLGKWEQLFEDIVRPVMSCRTADDCGAVWFGGCGGYYFSYSIVATDVAALKQSVARYNWFDAYWRVKWGLPCDVPDRPPPTLSCMDNVCAAK